MAFAPNPRVQSLPVGLGLVLLVVPGLIVVTACYLAVPACVVERRRALDSLIRSAELTRGRRWGVFGLLIVIGIASNASSSVQESYAVKLLGGLLGGVLIAASALVYLTFCAITMTVAYHDLRTEKEGGDVEQIAGMFA